MLIIYWFIHIDQELKLTRFFSIFRFVHRDRFKYKANNANVDFDSRLVEKPTVSQRHDIYPQQSARLAAVIHDSENLLILAIILFVPYLGYILARGYCLCHKHRSPQRGWRKERSNIRTCTAIAQGKTHPCKYSVPNSNVHQDKFDVIFQ